MKKEARHLYHKAIDSLTVSIELFNRPNNCGRVHGVLIFMDHSFEMLLKAAIINKGGKIKGASAKETIGFSTCVRKGFSDGKIKFLTRSATSIGHQKKRLTELLNKLVYISYTLFFI